MTEVYLDATPLVALGQVGETGLLELLDGDVVIPAAVREAVDTEPARSNLDRFVDEHDAAVVELATDQTDRALGMFDVEEPTADTRVVEGVLAARETGDAVGVVSDDRRVRHVAQGLGATVTGTYGIVIRAAVEELNRSAAKRVVRRVDSQGLHTTGELRERLLGDGP